jgi:hypothetical protein
VLYRRSMAHRYEEFVDHLRIQHQPQFDTVSHYGCRVSIPACRS